MKKLLFILSIAAFTFSCTNQTTDNAGETTEATIMTVDQLYSSIDTLVDQEVAVKGEVDHVCKHGGTKMVIFNPGSENSIHIDAGKSGNFRADEVMDQDVVVYGKVEEFRVDDAYIAELEGQLKDDMEKGAVDEGTAEEMDKAKDAEHVGEGAPENDQKHNKNKEFEERQAQIDNLKTKLAKLKLEGKDHISYYSVRCEKYDVVETPAEEQENATEVIEEKAE